jgi:hypothetical protein
MEGPPRTHPGPAPDPPPGPPRTSAAPFGIKATDALWARNPRGVPRSIDLDVPLSPPLTTKTTDSRTHAKLYGGLLDSDTFTGQYSQTRVQRRERRRPPTERSKRQRSVRPQQPSDTSFRKATTENTTAWNCTSRQQVLRAKVPEAALSEPASVS